MEYIENHKESPIMVQEVAVIIGIDQILEQQRVVGKHIGLM